MNNWKYKFSVIIIIFILVMSFSATAEEKFSGYQEDQITKVYKQNGDLIFTIAMGVIPGDRYISRDNHEYIVESVEGNKAIASDNGEIELVDNNKTAALPPLAAGEEKLVAIYHTHNGESYEPGPAVVEGRGDIHKIGKALANDLEKQGIKVMHSDNLHLPQDGAAYSRSRATALALAREKPDAIFDVHRDAIPNKEEYLTKVDGEVVPQVRIVVGRQNPNDKLNDKFARQIKAMSDKYTPGLIRDIFYGHGDYNQSIGPRVLLLEFGTYLNYEKNLEKSASLISIPIARALSAVNRPAASDSQNRSAFSTLAWILGIGFVILMGYLFLNEGSLEGVMNRIRGYFNKEIIDNRDDK